MFVLMYSPGPPSRSDALMRQLAAYLEEQNHQVGWRYFGAYNQYEKSDVVVTIGWHQIMQQIHDDQIIHDGTTLAISDGFMKRGWAPGSYFAVTKNGLHAYGSKVANMPDDRWRKLEIKLRPWQNNEHGHILIAHQHTLAFDGHDRQPWYHETIRILKERTKRTMILRPHPRDRKRSELPRGCLVSTRSFREDMENAYAVVTYDSNMAVDALLYGVPVFTRGKTMADPLACKDIDLIDDPPKPDRQQWAHDLAYCQWSVNELRAGLPWTHLIEGGLSHPVDEPAKEEDYEYSNEWADLEHSLTDWNVKNGQTPENVIKEIQNPKVTDAVRQRRARFIAMSAKDLVTYLIDQGIRANEDESKERLIGRAIHASL